MKTTFQRLLLTMCVILTVCMLASCGKDEPNGPNGSDGDDDNTPNVEQEDSLDWRSQLDTVKHPVCYPGEYLLGDDFSNIGFHIMIKDKEGNDLLRDPKVIQSDWYFEINGNRYHYGDSVPELVCPDPRIYTGGHFSGMGSIIFVNMWRPGVEECASHEPMEYSYTFVWPEKNIRHEMRVYVEFNKNILNDIADVQSTLHPGESSVVDRYYICRFVDGKVYKPYLFDSYLLIVD